MSPLANARHEAVLQAFLADPDRVGSHAYAKVYPGTTRSSAQAAWSRLLKNVAFAARLNALEGEVTAKVVATSAVTIEQVIGELAKIGFANAADYIHVNASGDPRIALDKMKRDQAAAVQSVSIDDYLDGRGEDAREVKRVTFKLHPKIPALVAIGEHLGAFARRRGESPAADGVTPDKPIDKTPPSRLEVARRIAFLLRVPPGTPAPANAPAPATAAEPLREKRAPR